MNDQPAGENKKTLPPPPPTKETDWSTPRMEIPAKSSHPGRTALVVIVIAVVVAVIVGVVIASGTATDDGTTPDTTPPAPVETVVQPQVIVDSDGQAISNTAPDTVLQPTRQNIVIDGKSIGMKVWADQYGVGDLAAIRGALDRAPLYDGHAAPGALRGACGEVVTAVVAARSHPAIPDQELDDSWKAALDHYETAAKSCQEATDAGDTVAIKESLDVFDSIQMLGPVFWATESNRTAP